MTEGTSQGLFIVVAIVIFGIFVGLSYTLFGSEGLSNDLKGLFTNATEQATSDLNRNYTDEKWFEFENGKIISFNPDGLAEYPKEISIPKTIKGIEVQTIGNNSFENYIFESVKIPNTVLKIENAAFYNTSLKKLDLGKSVKIIGNSAFYNARGGENWNELQEVILPDSVESLGQSVFDNRKILSLKVGKGLKTLGVGAFQNALLTGTLELPSNFESLGRETFRDSELDTLIVPEKTIVPLDWTLYNTKIIRK